MKTSIVQFCLPSGEEGFALRADIVSAQEQNYTLLCSVPRQYAPKIVGHESELAYVTDVAERVYHTGRAATAIMFTLGHNITIGIELNDPEGSSATLIVVDVNFTVDGIPEVLPREFSSVEEAQAHAGEIIDSITGNKFNWLNAKLYDYDEHRRRTCEESPGSASPPRSRDS